MKQEAYKCVGVWHDKYRLYYDVKHNEFFVLTPNFRITQARGYLINWLTGVNT